MFQILKINRKWSFLLYTRQTWKFLSIYITFPFIAGASMLLPAELTAAWTAPSTALLGIVLLCIKIIQYWKDDSQLKSGKVR